MESLWFWSFYETGLFYRFLEKVGLWEDKRSTNVNFSAGKSLWHRSVLGN